MKIKHYMTDEVICVEPQTKVSQAVNLMEKHHIHRLPVIEDGKLVGLVTEAIIADNSASPATSLSIYEINYLLSQTTVGEIMDKKPLTVSKEVLIEEAAVQMVEKGLTELTVVDREQHVIGIITYKDIFKALVDLTGYQTPGARFIVHLEYDRPGELEGVTDILRQSETNIRVLYVNRIADDIEVTIQISDEDASAIIHQLSTQGYRVETY